MFKILVPTDYSNCSIAALKQAGALARGADGMLLIMHVVENGSVPDLKTEQDPTHQEMANLLQSFSESNPPLRYEERHVEGIPVSAILSVATEEKADLIVMGTSGRSGLKRLILGSVAEEVTRRAPCPVLTLKAQKEEHNDHPLDTWQNFRTLGQSTTTPIPADVLTSAEINDNPTLALISRAIAARATDIHIDPAGEEYSVRFRIDGKLSNFCRLSNEVGRALLMQLKVTANLDIADPFRPKEGRLALPEALRDYEIRITAVPVVDGEAVSLRVLSRYRLMRPLDQLGLSTNAQSRIEQILRHGEGIVLVTGPTGSGKTTTLYSMLHQLDNGTQHIVTIEDPVEYDIPTFRQLSVDAKHGITMTSGLRTLLRLDPDVVLVGEIRDADAAETAMRAASSGKYVFSSLHTRDVASTVTAIRDLHIDNRSLAGNLAGVISQRLLRRLCAECSKAASTTEQEADVFRANGLEPPKEIRHPVGCSRCRGTGYYDRIGLFEVVSSDDDILRAINEGRPENELRHLIQEHGICTLQSDALQKVAEGIISLEDCSAMMAIELVPQTVVAN
jgi:type II secretory ATPase GspE/PulE/Tfp pilus assembly ATPase PilB-like protein